jgi:flagellar basal-body rod protein FlgC
MTMISAYQSALSALQAFGTRINSNANNIANSLTDGFKRTGVNLASMQPQGGVKATVAKVNSQGPMVYKETNNGIELIEQSNVDLVNEMTDMTLNTDYYKANLKTIQTSDQMTKSLLDIKA